MYAILYTNAELNVDAIHSECGHERWAPLMVYRPKEDPKGLPRLIIIQHKDVADRFIERNITPQMQVAGWLRGSVSLTRDDLA